MSLCLGSQAWLGLCNLVPIPGPEQPHSSPEDTRGTDQSLHALAQLGGLIWVPSLRNSRPRDKPKFTEHTHCTGGILGTDHVRSDGIVGPARTTGSSELPEAA